MDDKFIFPFPSTKTAIFMDGKRKSKVTYQGASAELCQDF